MLGQVDITRRYASVDRRRFSAIDRMLPIIITGDCTYKSPLGLLGKRSILIKNKYQGCYKKQGFYNNTVFIFIKTIEVILGKWFELISRKGWA